MCENQNYAFNLTAQKSLNLTMAAPTCKFAFWLEAYIRSLIVDIYKNRSYAFKLTTHKSLNLTVVDPIFKFALWLETYIRILT